MARGERQQERELAAEIQRLYGLPLAEFTAARNALAARLKKEGRAGAAEQVKSLVKPTPSAWAVNRLLRSERDAVEALLAAGERARSAQAKVAAGKAGGGELREALEEQRRQRDGLKRRAAGFLAEGGRKATATQLERLTDDLDALSLDPTAAPVKERGWLDADLEPPGFEVLAGFQLAAGPSHGLRLVRGGAEGARREPAGRSREERRPSSAPAARPSREEEARGKWEEAVRARREREEERRRQRIAKAEERLDRAREEARTVGAEAARLARAADEAEKAAAAARREADRARERSDRAAERLERAREELAAEKSGKRDDGGEG